MQFNSSPFELFIMVAVLGVIKGFEGIARIKFGRKVELYSSNGDNTELVTGIITLFYKTTMQECITACKKRKSCSYVNYHFRTTMCFLLRGTEINETLNIVESDGYGLGEKSSWDLTNYLTCNACTDKNVCNADTGECVIKECELVHDDASFSYTDGNIFSVGKKIVHRCNTHYDITVYTTTSSTCRSNGTWTDTNFTCVEINECESDPCQNGGHCNDLLGHYSCTCASGWMGINCETEINECDSDPCLNSGQCSDMVNGYSCSCVQGFSGINCEIDINECESDPCANGANCQDLVNGYQCNCEPGYTGNQCQTDINECQLTPCANGGTCTDLINAYSCTCAPGWEGINCDIDINECSSGPCDNGGTCTNLINAYSCACAAGWEGTNCSTDINDCFSGLCLNDGTCIDLVDAYTCTCASGWSGANCEMEMNECASNPCLNEGTCVDLLNGYTCNCMQGYTGITCQTALTCPFGWSKYQNSCYRLEAYKVIYSQAKQNCANLGGHLADVTSQEEMDFLKQLYLEIYSIYAIDGVWVSSNDINIEGHWVLSDETSATYLNWHTGQPDQELATDDCAQVWPNQNFQWNDVYCDYSFWFFCEQEL